MIIYAVEHHDNELEKAVAMIINYAIAVDGLTCTVEGYNKLVGAARHYYECQKHRFIEE